MFTSRWKAIRRVALAAIVLYVLTAVASPAMASPSARADSASPARPAKPLTSAVVFARFWLHNIASKPGIAACNGKLYAAFTDNVSSSHSIYITSTATPTTTSSWPDPVPINEQSQQIAGPALACWQGHLYIAWAGTNSGHSLNTGYYTDGSPNLSNKHTFTDSTFDSPDIAPFSVDGRLYIVWRGTSNSTINVMSSPNGTTWDHKKTFGDTSPIGPSVAEFNGTHGDHVYISWHGTDVNEHVWTGWWDQNNPNVGLQDHTDTGRPSLHDVDLVAAGSFLFDVYITSEGQCIDTTQSTNGVNWDLPISYDPAVHDSATLFNGKIWVTFTNNGGGQFNIGQIP